MPRNWSALYDLQDSALNAISGLEHGFYLTGGTALGRGYYHHRYSEDLDFFANDAADFALWRDRCIEAIRRTTEASGILLDVVLREARFGRLMVHGAEPLKIEFINDVPCRIGQPWTHPELGRLDTRENILANKISALVDRDAPKDLADIFWLCCRDSLDILSAIEGAAGKAAGIFPPLVASALERGLGRGVPSVFWVQAPSADDFRRGIEGLVQRIVA
jgi:hypothetical protein